MITTAGSALIATVYPIALFVVAVNRREVPPTGLPRGRLRTFRLIIETAQHLAVIGAVISVIACVFAVSIDRTITNPWYIAFIASSGLVLGVSALSVLQSLAFSAATAVMGPIPTAANPRRSRMGTRSRVRRPRMLSSRAPKTRARFVPGQRTDS
jgi:hypothetical protein